jgi:cytidylate kinase
MAIVTITRGPKVGGRAIAECLASRMGYKCLTTTDVVDQSALKYNILREELYKRLEEIPTFWKRLTYEHKRDLIYIQCSVLEAAKQDDIVYHGLAGQLFLAGIKHVLKVRIEAPFGWRTKTAVEELNITESKAIEYLQRADNTRKTWVKIFYGENWNDPALYDLSINRKNMSENSICDLIIGAINCGDFNTTQDSLATINNLHLECEVKAALSADEKLWNLPIEIKASNGNVTLRGLVKNERTKKELIEIVENVKGVVKCWPAINVADEPLKGGILGR